VGEATKLALQTSPRPAVGASALALVARRFRDHGEAPCEHCGRAALSPVNFRLLTTGWSGMGRGPSLDPTQWLWWCEGWNCWPQPSCGVLDASRSRNFVQELGNRAGSSWVLKARGVGRPEDWSYAQIIRPCLPTSTCLLIIIRRLQCCGSNCKARESVQDFWWALDRPCGHILEVNFLCHRW
jgi:hypothetical protein